MIHRTLSSEVRILIVDDNADFAELTADILGQVDSEFVVDVETDPTCVPEYLDKSIDCIVSDYNMPEMNGIDLLETVRKEYPELPFILFTGKGSEAVASDAISAGVTDYLQKSSGTEQYEILSQRIKNAVENRRTKEVIEQNSEAMDSAPVGITIVDVTQDEIPFIYVNDGFEEITGYSKEYAVGRNWCFLQGERTADESVAAIREAIQNGETATVELRNYQQDGTEFWNRVSIAPIKDDEGTVTHYVVFQEDITEYKRFEQEIEELLEQFEEFGSVLSHDLKKPLSKARSRLELARATEDWEELCQVDEYIEHVIGLIDDFADVMRNGKLVKDMQTVAVGPVSESVWDHLLTGDATLEIKGDPEIMADEQALRRLLENLFYNACEHSDSDVRVCVGTLPDGFYVADDGPGIPPDQRDEIFSPGYTTHEDGSGMGLTSVWQIVLAHDWEISVTKSQWGGARFEITTQVESAQSRRSPEKTEA